MRPRMKFSIFILTAIITVCLIKNLIIWAAANAIIAVLLIYSGMIYVRKLTFAEYLNEANTGLKKPWHIDDFILQCDYCLIFAKCDYDDNIRMMLDARLRWEHRCPKCGYYVYVNKVQ